MILLLIALAIEVEYDMVVKRYSSLKGFILRVFLYLFTATLSNGRFICTLISYFW
jgi:hypothetical protein